jgi:hypothetical protein
MCPWRCRGDVLLDSDDAERLPIIRRLIATTTASTKPLLWVVCFDGTANQIDAGNLTSVAKMFGMVVKSDPNSQLAYYDPGVGTRAPASAHSVIRRTASLLSMRAVGAGMKTDVAQAYQYLMRPWRPGHSYTHFPSPAWRAASWEALQTVSIIRLDSWICLSLNIFRGPRYQVALCIIGIGPRQRMTVPTPHTAHFGDVTTPSAPAHPADSIEKDSSSRLLVTQARRGSGSGGNHLKEESARAHRPCGRFEKGNRR